MILSLHHYFMYVIYANGHLQTFYEDCTLKTSILTSIFMVSKNFVNECTLIAPYVEHFSYSSLLINSFLLGIIKNI